MKLRVPGKIMLAGEYAVLDGCRSLAFTVDRFLEVEAEKRKTPKHLVCSTIWDEDVELGHEAMADNPLCDAVWHAAKGDFFHVSVDSELCIEDGMGSSSALRLAVFSALAPEKEITREVKNWPSALELARAAYSRQLNCQGSASGYDIITQLYGGLVTMTRSKVKWPETVSKLEVKDFDKWVHVIVGGKGAPTEAQMGSTSSWLKANNLWPKLRELSEELVEGFIKFLSNPSSSDLTDLITKVDQHRALFKDSPKFPKDLAAIIEASKGFNESWTYKTTGAGGEDAILLIGLREDIKDVLSQVDKLGWRLFSGKFSGIGAHIVEDELEEV